MKPITLLAISAIAMTCSCNSQKDATPAVVAAPQAQTMGAVSAMPKAVIYKTNGDYNDHVVINLSHDGKRPVSFPAPTDITEASTPLPLKGGWLLDRRGAVGANTVFLTYTYAQYAKLPKAPSIDELMASIMPVAKVTETKVLPIVLSKVIQDPELADPYID